MFNSLRFFCGLQPRISYNFSMAFKSGHLVCHNMKLILLDFLEILLYKLGNVTFGIIFFKENIEIEMDYQHNHQTQHNAC